MDKKKIRVRFAPSPTGYLHIGGARTALFCYLFSKSYDGDFILRIEDTDRKRSTTQSVEQVIESMKWLGLEWDEGPEIGGEYAPYFQSERLDIYEKAFDILKEKKLIYPCFCTNEELIKKKAEAKALNIPNVYDKRCYYLDSDEVEYRIKKGDSHTYRFIVEDKELLINDLVKGKIEFNTGILGDFIVKKKDGFPTYNFAVVVDDIHMKITHVLRGDDHLSNTPKQILLYEALGEDLPIYGHISTILNENKEKLSKRDGAMGILDFEKKGYLKEALINFLALLGWSSGDETEILTKNELIKRFSNNKFNKAPAVFDYNKLNYFNSYYIRNMDDDDLYVLFKTYLDKVFINEDEYLLNDKGRLKLLLNMVKDHCILVNDVEDYLRDFTSFSFFIEEESKSLLNNENKLLIDEAISFFSKEGDFYLKEDEFRDFMNFSKEKLKIKGKEFFKPMRVALTGKKDGYELSEFLKILNRKSIVNRLKKTVGEYR